MLTAAWTTQEILEVFDRVHYKNRQEVPWSWVLEAVYNLAGEVSGWMVQGRFHRPDTHTHKWDFGLTRKEFVAVGAHPDTVIKTCWVLIDLTERHEAMESFHVDGVRVFDPHIPLENLKAAERASLEPKQVVAVTAPEARRRPLPVEEDEAAVYAFSATGYYRVIEQKGDEVKVVILAHFKDPPYWRALECWTRRSDWEYIGLVGSWPE